MYIPFSHVRKAISSSTSDNTVVWGVFRLDPDQNMAGIICQWFLQAIVLLLTQRLLYGNLKDERRLKSYVIGVNVMCLMHTLFRTILAFDYIHGTAGEFITVPEFALPVMITIETMVIQTFFLFRCWTIMAKRAWAIAPLVVVWISSGVAGVFFAVATDYCPKLVTTTLATWVALSCSLDLTMTVITMIYLIQRQREYKAYSRVLMTIWNMLWLAAVPPMLAMIGLIITMYILHSGSWATFIYDILSKLFVLSLLIAITGRERAASKLKETTQMELCLAALGSGSTLGRSSG
ncbi:hypothetical protein RSOLAG1IB_06391 [Rhizoctonia solani AG-1 IB]|uniref:Uncharacterized protein n=1 Tax=Thanatephorus cucumeris (strain AG1-IB / isolate 7/3/14) TaxID=1108050 RepID=A0A0B7F645_THACB|nr:hypothetical protein RSOLAG1IB_06391 [Rhizoctonia solani AG-1 IB]